MVILREAVWTGRKKIGECQGSLNVYSSFMVFKLKSEWLCGFVLATRTRSKSSELELILIGVFLLEFEMQMSNGDVEGE